MKLKNVALAISKEYITYFTIFDVSQLSYKSSNFARQTSPMPWVKGLKDSGEAVYLTDAIWAIRSYNS